MPASTSHLSPPPSRIPPCQTNLIPFSDSPVPARINKPLTAAEGLKDECRAAWIGLLPADAVDNLQPARFVPGMRAYQPWTPRRRNPIHRALFELVRRQPQNLIHLDGIPVTHRAILRGPVGGTLRGNPVG